MGNTNFKQAVWCLAAKQTGETPLDSSRAADSSRSNLIFLVVLKAVSGCLLCKKTLDESSKADPVKCHEVRRITALRQWSLRVKPTKHGALTVSKAEASLC